VRINPVSSKNENKWSVQHELNAKFGILLVGVGVEVKVGEFVIVGVGVLTNVGVVVGVNVIVGETVAVTVGVGKVSTQIGPLPVGFSSVGGEVTKSPLLLVMVKITLSSPAKSSGGFISTSPFSKVSVVPSSYVIVPVVSPEFTVMTIVVQLFPKESHKTTV
jgi:hypothetical protein